MDVKIDVLVLEKDRPEHIVKHKVAVDEVLEVVSGDYVYIKGKLNRWLLIGKTNKDRFLTIVVGKRKQKNTYGLVTARPSSRDERNFYQEFALQHGGEDNDKN